MTQEEFDELEYKLYELYKETGSKKGTLLCVLSDKDTTEASGVLVGMKKDQTIGLVRAILADKSGDWKEVLEEALRIADVLSGEYAKRKRKAKVLWIISAIVYAVVAVVEMAPFLEAGNVLPAIGCAVLNTSLWFMCFLLTKATFRV